MSPSDDKPVLPPAMTASDIAPAPPTHGPLGRLRNYFLTGLILVGPIYITVNLTWWLVNWVDGQMRPFIPISLRTETYLPFRVPGYGVIIALSALTLLGFLTANLVGRTLVEFGESLLNRMPIVRPIYKTMKQIFETLFSKSGGGFGKVALAEFPAGMWSVVFLASPPTPDVASRLPGQEFVSCFLPCTPNPTTGFFFYAPRNQVIELDITVEQAMTLIMSAGMAQPNAEAQKKLAALVENGRAKAATVAPPTAPVP
ncbi:DUF502 domain-containing protein [Rhodoplanes sp. Z2-YC6860]|uniref:DUF502 domain-containing protein n=1 Tax=Rhodoplanes sp. Z2-YC6860 TaxID=674703 RepID=UPI00078BE2CE|nr:hypothetical protein RHPLAN_35560 [Rhodoplanes sp. Z2-YC6860]